MYHGGRRLCLALAGAVAAATITIATPVAAQAEDTAVAAVAAQPPLPQTVSADALPTVQIDGVAWDQAVVGNTVYVGGQFNNARPAGAAAGTNQTPRANMLAYNLETGALNTSFAPSFNGAVNRVAVTPDGSKLVAVGAFTQVNGIARNRVAVFNLPSGTLNTAVTAGANSAVQSVAVTNTTAYIGGYFGSVGTAGRNRVAAISLTNGAVLPFSVPVDNGIVQAIVVSPDSSRVVLGGSFTSVGGSSDPGYGLAQVDAVTGAALPLPLNQQVRNAGTEAAVLSLTSDGTSFYGTGYVFGPGGNVEGTFSAGWADGSLTWLEDCHGDTYDVAAIKDVVYTASHKHYCGNSGGFPQTTPWTFYHSNAFSKSVQGTNTRDIYGYPDHPGTSRPELLNWFPQTDVGSYTGKYQATWTVEGNSDYVVMGGEFPRVNGVGQQGLVRYAIRSKAPNKQGPRVGGAAAAPKLQSLTPGEVRVTWPANNDRDDSTLTYEVYRDTNTNKVYSTTQTASFWQGKPMIFTDKGLRPGASVRYAIRAIDPSGNLVNSTWVSTTVASADSLGEYGRAVLADGATKYWAFNEPAGSTDVTDWAGADNTTSGSGVTRGTPGGVAGGANTASTFDGSSNAPVIGTEAVPGPNTFSQEVWFRTTTSGKIAGFGSGRTGDSGSHDRHIYVDSDGRVVFGVYPNQFRTVSSRPGLNDNEWHQVVATLGPNGMVLYVDGKKVASRDDTTTGEDYTGYWRVGGDNTWSGNRYFNGQIDDYSVYNKVLTPQQVNSHWVASGRSSTIPSRPADRLGQAVYDSEPELYWRLDDTGTTAASAVAGDGNGTYTGSYQQGQGGVDGRGSSVHLDGWSEGQRWGNVVANLPTSNPTTFSQEVWFKTTTNQGGRIVGLGDSPSGDFSGNYDRMLWMRDDGRVAFGVWTGTENRVTSATALNDGKWHHVVTMLSSAGMKLFVDGELVDTNSNTGAQNYTGYWKLGADNAWGGNARADFDGQIDEVAIYGRALPAAEVRSHFVAGGGVVPNTLPSAEFATSADGLTVSFDASASADTDGRIESYAWDFGDGQTATGVKVNHTYAQGQKYTVKLKVTDDLGGEGQKASDVDVVAPNSLPTARFESTAADLKATFDGSGSTDSDGRITSYEWDFGDGTSSGSTAEARPEHVYDAAGTYAVKLTVKDDRGGSDSVTRQVTVQAANVAPVARFDATASGLAAALDASGSTDSDGTVASYSWSFGNGTTGVGVKPSVTYAEAGTYEVKLTVTDNRGGTAEVSRRVTVTAPPPPADNTVASDTFQRTVTGGWGTSNVGGPWTIRGVASRYNVNNGKATWVVPKSTLQWADLNGVSSQRAKTTVEFSLDKIVPGQFIGLTGRQVGSEYYAVRIDPEAGGAVRMHLLRTGNSMGGAGTIVPGLTLVPGQRYKLAIEVKGVNATTISAKVWKASDPEPASWNRTVTNSFAALQAPGGLGLFNYLAGTAADTPVTVSYHGFTSVAAN